MQINHKKSAVIPFNFTRKYDFTPTLTYDSQPLEVIYKTKLLGLMVTSDGKFEEHIRYLTTKAKTRLFFLRRLKVLGANVETKKCSIKVNDFNSFKLFKQF